LQRGELNERLTAKSLVTPQLLAAQV
jgi:hypothetical protein